ncbi:hypothetical protein KKA14_13360 [bacterium]|nr:hypothetical protein [bacterium]
MQKLYFTKEGALSIETSKKTIVLKDSCSFTEETNQVINGYLSPIEKKIVIAFQRAIFAQELKNILTQFNPLD